MIKLIACTNHWILNGSTITLVLSCITITVSVTLISIANVPKEQNIGKMIWPQIHIIYIYVCVCLPQKHIKDPADLFSITGTTLLLSCAAHACLHCGTFLYRSPHWRRAMSDSDGNTKVAQHMLTVRLRVSDVTSLRLVFKIKVQ